MAPYGPLTLSLALALTGCVGIASEQGTHQVPQTREFTLEAVEKDIELYPGEVVHMWTYNGQVPGPLIRVTEGDHLVVRFYNNASLPHTIHFHGDHPYAMDGEDHQAVAPGGSFTYDFIAGPAGAYVYHCHVDTPTHIGMGLYGQFIIDPPGGLPGPAPDKEFFAVFSDWNPSHNTTAETYLLNGKAFPGTTPFRANVGDHVRLYLSSLSEFPVAVHFHGSLPHEVWPDAHPIDVTPLAHAETRIVDYTAKEPGAWMFHDHYEQHLENHGVYPGGSMSAIEVGPQWWGKFNGLMTGMSGMNTTSPHMSGKLVPIASVPANATRVSIKEYAFTERGLTVAPGTTIAWTNDGTMPHTVTSDTPGGPLDSGLIPPGEAYVVTLAHAGLYGYHCVPHSAKGADGTFKGMTGSVSVSQ